MNCIIHDSSGLSRDWLVHCIRLSDYLTKIAKYDIIENILEASRINRTETYAEGFRISDSIQTISHLLRISMTSNIAVVSIVRRRYNMQGAESRAIALCFRFPWHFQNHFPRMSSMWILDSLLIHLPTKCLSRPLKYTIYDMNHSERMAVAGHSFVANKMLAKLWPVAEWIWNFSSTFMKVINFEEKQLNLEVFWIFHTIKFIYQDL